MEIGQILCPGCGAPITLMQGQKTGVCEYCQTSFNVDDLNYKSEAEKIKIQMENGKIKKDEKLLNTLGNIHHIFFLMRHNYC